MGARTAQPIDPAQPLHNPRWEAFALALAETGNQSEAYRRAYPRSRQWREASVANKASALMRNGDISARVSHLRDASRTAKMLSRAEALEIAAAFARDAKLPARDRLAAIERVAKIEAWDGKNLNVTGHLPDLLAAIHERRL